MAAGLYNVAMYIERVPNRNSPPCILLRESYREGSKVRKRTIANLTHWPKEIVDGLRVLIKTGNVTGEAGDSFQIVRSLPHGHVAAVLKSVHRLGLSQLLAAKPCRERDLAIAMIVARVLDPRSKLATARTVNAETAASTLGLELDVEQATEDELYEAMDWLLKRQHRIENKLAARHLREDTLILYDVSSSYYTGRHCSLAKFGYNRDGKKGFPQIVYGLLCDVEGRPISVEVFEGNTSDPKTLSSQIDKIRKRFGLKRIVLVGDRGMITTARIDEEFRDVDGLDWITALRAPAIRKLVEQDTIRMSLFDRQDLAEISSEDYPGERLIVCRNPLLAEERGRKRETLLAATERDLDKVVAATRRSRRRLKGKDRIGLRVGKVIDRHKMEKHFVLDIADDGFTYRRNEEKIEQEKALDGLYVIRTSVDKKRMDADSTVRAYKDLAKVERAFRCLKSVDMKVRPIYHRLPNRVRAHVFLCMPAYYVEWHMRRKLAPILFDDDEKEIAESLRTSIVAPAKRSAKAQAKARTKRTDQGEPVHSFRTLLTDLATITKNWIQPNLPGASTFHKVTQPTDSQSKALDLLGVHL